MAFSKTLNREVQPSDFRVQIGKTVSKFEAERVPVEPTVRAELIGALAGQLAKHNTIRKEEQHSITYMLDFFVIPVDDFMGLVADMARAILQTSAIEQQEGQPKQVIHE